MNSSKSSNATKGLNNAQRNVRNNQANKSRQTTHCMLSLTFNTLAEISMMQKPKARPM